MPENQPPEVIVIGAGLGGLAAACDLARAGVRVLVLERHSLPGGFASSFVRGRFEFETALHEIARTGAVDFIRELAPDLEFLDIPDAYRVILTDEGVDFRAPFGPEEFTRSVISEVPESAESVHDFMELCAENFDAFAYLGENPRPSPGVLFREYGNFLRTGAAVLDEAADAVNLPKKARDLIYPYWCYLGMASNRVSFSIWASMVESYLRFGAVIPRSRSHGMSLAIARCIRENGGRIRYSSPVRRLVTRGRRITGVVLESGETISCSRVISNVSPHRIFGRFSDRLRLPLKAAKMINTRKPGISFFIVYLGLNADHRELGLNDYSYFIAPHMDTVELERKFLNRHDPEPLQAAVCLNTVDPDASPPGTTILSITIGTRPEAWSDVDPWDYQQEKQRFAERAIRQFERAVGVEISDHIEEIETAAPPTFARYVGSWDGTVYGYEPTPWDGIIPRVVARNRERIFTNLRFCGGNAFRSLGYSSSILSGRTAAELTLKEMGRS